MKAPRCMKKKDEFGFESLQIKNILQISNPKGFIKTNQGFLLGEQQVRQKN